MNSRNFLLYIRATQGHTGGNLIAPELMGHVAIPDNWKEFLFHRGYSSDVTSILKSGLIAGGRERKEGRQTIFFTQLNPFGDNPDEEEPSDDLSKPRKAHYYSEWTNSQDAVCWISLARAQDKGLRFFWQTRSHAVIVYSSVPADCIYKVISPKGERTLFERLSTPRPAPKIVLKSAWQSQQQQQQQQDTSESASSSSRKLVQREEQGNPTDNPELPSVKKLKRSNESLVEKEEPTSGRMGQIQEVVEK